MILLKTADAGTKYPICKDCKVEMNQSLLTMVWDPNVLDFGWDADGGMGFVSVCPKCKRVELNYVAN